MLIKKILKRKPLAEFEQLLVGGNGAVADMQAARELVDRDHPAGPIGRILLQPPSGQRRSAPSPPQQEERVGERRPILLDAPRPARSSRGEGEEDFR